MEREGRGPGWVLLGLLPLLGLGVLLAFIVLNGAGVGRQDAPPVEDLSVQRVALPTPYELVLSVRNGGPQPVTLSQVVVNDAIWDFEGEPGRKIPRLGSATVTIPYSWVEGEAYEIVLITSTGTTFDAEVPVAVLTPGFSGETFWRYALIGTYVGLIPVALGLLWYPFSQAPRRCGDRGRPGPHAGAPCLAGRGHAARGSRSSRTVAWGLLRRPPGADGGAALPPRALGGRTAVQEARGDEPALDILPDSPGDRAT